MVLRNSYFYALCASSIIFALFAWNCTLIQSCSAQRSGFKNEPFCNSSFYSAFYAESSRKSVGTDRSFYGFWQTFYKRSFFYGLNTGLTFVVMIEWFCCFNRVMTSEKFTYLFAHVFPAISLMLVMIFRMVPLFTKRMHDIKKFKKSNAYTTARHKRSFYCTERFAWFSAGRRRNDSNEHAETRLRKHKTHKLFMLEVALCRLFYTCRSCSFSSFYCLWN